MAGKPTLDRRGVFLENDAAPLLRPIQSAPASADLVKSAAESLDARSKAATQQLVHHGTVGVIDILNTLRNLGAAANIIDFRVPNGQMAIITNVAVVCDNPGVTMCNAMVWRLLIDGQELPHMNTTLLFNRTGYRMNAGNVTRPMAITPAVAQSGQLVSIEIAVSSQITGNNVVFTGRLVGRLVNPGSVGAFSIGEFNAT